MNVARTIVTKIERCHPRYRQCHKKELKGRMSGLGSQAEDRGFLGRCRRGSLDETKDEANADQKQYRDADVGMDVGAGPSGGRVQPVSNKWPAP
ncbi:hypothetical protein ACC731_37525, partial [Rhizobium ruizarguesonis]